MNESSNPDNGQLPCLPAADPVAEPEAANLPMTLPPDSAEVNVAMAADGAGMDEDEAFPVEALPPIPRALVAAISEAYAVPATVAAIATLGVASRAALGLTVRGISQLRTPANLYLIVGAPAGQGKSTSFAPVVRPLRELQGRIREDLNPESRHRPVEPARPEAEVILDLDPGFRWITCESGESPQPSSLHHPAFRR